jgi:hypothetical protein
MLTLRDAGNVVVGARLLGVEVLKVRVRVRFKPAMDTVDT